MTPDELASLQPVADQLAAAGTWTRADFDEADSDWQAPLATACNYFPRLLAEVLRLQAGLTQLRQAHSQGDIFCCPAVALSPGPCQGGADAHNAWVDALLRGGS